MLLGRGLASRKGQRISLLHPLTSSTQRVDKRTQRQTIHLVLAMQASHMTAVSGRRHSTAPAPLLAALSLACLAASLLPGVSGQACNAPTDIVASSDAFCVEYCIQQARQGQYARPFTYTGAVPATLTAPACLCLQLRRSQPASRAVPATCLLPPHFVPCRPIAAAVL